MAFSLEVPDENEVKAIVRQQVEPTEERRRTIAGATEGQAGQIMSVDLDSFESRREITSAIESMGNDLATKSTAKNEILARRIGELGQGGGQTGEVARGLADLSIQMRDLDPSTIDFAKSGGLGKFFNPVRRYFERYKTADAEIADIVRSLDRGKATLTADNTTLELEEAAMRDLTKKLSEKVDIAMQLDRSLTTEIERRKAQNEDEKLVKFVEEEVLFPLRQKVMDFQQLLVVNQQGIVAMEVIRRNNLELIRAVDRAQSVTVSSLRVAVTVAGALYNQKIVLDKVKALNATTESMIASTSRMLKEQGTEIQRQATEATVSPETLKQAFADALGALDDISTYKQEALPRIAQTIQEFKQIAEKGEARLKQMEDAGAFDR
ncbi:KlaA protein [Olsenella sp. oral taxon 807]|uniref:toxic anion resistance protein n=1 Tax=Olsenella sp. oral taxon 807 TaxID=712411 RepID=UPI000679F091|nr:toxic anion resistance protein [Olsenella sp. oral taxon 807]AKT49561.1 KlaA protein [Olsenella sp. oral taxon 807]